MSNAVIGGADGPTVVFVSGSLGGGLALIGCGLLLLGLVGGIIFAVVKRNSE